MKKMKWKNLLINRAVKFWNQDWKIGTHVQSLMCLPGEDNPISLADIKTPFSYSPPQFGSIS